MARKKSPPLAVVVNLSEERARRRLAGYRKKIAQVLDSNRRAVARLYHNGALFSREGLQAGRDLLLAHQNLLRVVSLLDRLTNEGDVPAPRRSSEVNAVFRKLDSLVARTNELTHRTGHYLARLRGE